MLGGNFITSNGLSGYSGPTLLDFTRDFGTIHAGESKEFDLTVPGAVVGQPAYIVLPPLPTGVVAEPPPYVVSSGVVRVTLVNTIDEDYLYGTQNLTGVSTVAKAHSASFEIPIELPSNLNDGWSLYNIDPVTDTHFTSATNTNLFYLFNLFNSSQTYATFTYRRLCLKRKNGNSAALRAFKQLGTFSVDLPAAASSAQFTHVITGVTGLKQGDLVVCTNGLLHNNWIMKYQHATADGQVTLTYRSFTGTSVNPAAYNTHIFAIDPARKHLVTGLSASATLDFPSIASNGNTSLTVSCPHAQTNDFVLAFPPTNMLADVQPQLSWVTSNGVIATRIKGYGGANLDNPPGDWHYIVFPWNHRRYVGNITFKVGV